MRRNLTIILAIALIAGPYSRLALAEPSREYAVKAAFIYNFIQFTEWPPEAFASAQSPFIIGIIGDDPFDHTLEHAIAGKSISGHPMQLKHLNAINEIPDCAVLFVPVSNDGQLGDIFNEVGSRPVLTVGETDVFSAAGGIIGFYIEDSKIRFQIDPDSAARAKIKISSKLMKLARIFKR